MIRVRPFLLLFLLGAGLSLWSSKLWAQEPQLRWAPVTGAGGYLVEIRTQTRKSVVSETVTEPTFVLDLAPGAYEVRITSLNKFLHRGDATIWNPFLVQKAVVPVITGVLPATVREGGEQKFLVRGTGLSASTEIILHQEDSKEIRPDQNRVLSPQDIEFSMIQPLAPGTYTIVLKNPPDQTAELSGALTVLPAPVSEVIKTPEHVLPVPEPLPETVIRPETVPQPVKILSAPARIPLSFGVGYGAALPFSPWNEIVGPSYESFQAFALWPLVHPMGLLVQWEYSGFASKEGTDLVPSSLKVQGLSVGGFADVDWLVPVRFRLTPGVVVTQASINGTGVSSVDFFATGGASILVKGFEPYFGELGADYRLVFYAGTPLQNLELNLRTGMSF